jgi:hypothetical protein
MPRRTIGKTNYAGLTFFWYSSISISQHRKSARKTASVDKKGDTPIEGSLMSIELGLILLLSAETTDSAMLQSIQGIINEAYDQRSLQSTPLSTA